MLAEKSKLAALSVLALAMVIALVFVPAGRLDWAAGWSYVALLGVSSALMVAYVMKRNPELARHRMRLGKGTKWWDGVALALIKVAFLSMVVLGGLDAGRFGWSSAPSWLIPVGAVAHSVGLSIVTVSMAVNPHFETTVRIQRERDHRVVDAGPYGIVRHPGYAGFLLVIFATPAVLLSWWAFLPAAALALVLLVRTALEDRTLRAELEGYSDYVERVRSRLLPGIW